MRAVITPFFTRVVEKLPPISAKLRGLLNQQITENLLSKHEFPTVMNTFFAMPIFMDSAASAVRNKNKYIRFLHL